MHCPKCSGSRMPNIRCTCKQNKKRTPLLSKPHDEITEDPKKPQKSLYTWTGQRLAEAAFRHKKGDKHD